MDQVTQQNAAMVEQATAAAAGLKNESVDLSRMVGRFKVGAQSEPMAPPARAAAPAARAPKLVAAGGGRAAVAADGWEEF
jgi:methyl-accepting chemotaxis protein